MLFTIGNVYFLPIDKTYAYTADGDKASRKYIVCMTSGEVCIHNILTEEEILKAYPNARKVNNIKEAIEIGFNYELKK